MKYERLKKLIVCFISVILSFGMSACKNNIQTEISNVKTYFTDGVHDFTAPETSEFLVKDGKSDYVVVIPENASETIKIAKDEFITLFQEATGIRLPSVVETGSGYEHNASSKYISIGETKLFQSSGISIDKTVLKNDGVRIVTKDKSIYLIGGGDSGSCFAVYDFMQIYFNFDVYYYDCWDLDTGVTNLKLRNFNVTDIPDIEQRASNYGYLINNYKNNCSYRFREIGSGYGSYLYNLYEKYDCQGFGTCLHNSSEVINQYTDGFDIYGQYWLSNNGDQLCYTAHGNAEAYEKLVKESARKIEDVIKANKDDRSKHTFTITMEDNPDICTCDACLQAKEKYGENVGAAIIYTNDVMEEVVDNWMNTEEGAPYKRNDLKLLFFAYSSFVQPPTHFDAASGKYVVNHPDLEMREDVGVFFCLSGNRSFVSNIYAPENDEFREAFKAWSDVANTMYIWAYDTNFYEYLGFHNSGELYDSEGMQFFVSNGVDFWFNQGQGSNEDVTAFHALKCYINSKLSWDCTLNVEMLVNKFFNAMYGEAASIMMDMYQYSKSYAMQIRYENGWMNQGSIGLSYQKYHHLPVLKRQMEYCDQAIKKIEGLYKNVDQKKYEKYKFHIELEWLSPAYFTETLWSQLYMSESDAVLLRARLKEVGSKLGKICASEAAKEGLADYFRNL